MEIIGLTGSTNADLAQRLTSGEPVAEGHWLIADRQNAGRGRLGRVWNDGLGNFMGSTVVRIDAHQPPAPSLALVAGVAVQACVADLVPPPRCALLKWPNDVLVGQAKVAGILLEAVAGFVIVGIGVNLASAPQLPDRETTALSDYGPAPDRDAFAMRLAARFAQELVHWRQYGLSALVHRWQAAAHPIGTPLLVREASGRVISGNFCGLNEDGALRLQLSGGTVQTIHAGDVELA